MWEKWKISCAMLHQTAGEDGIYALMVHILFPWDLPRVQQDTELSELIFLFLWFLIYSISLLQEARAVSFPPCVYIFVWNLLNFNRKQWREAKHNMVLILWWQTQISMNIHVKETWSLFHLMFMFCFFLNLTVCYLWKDPNEYKDWVFMCISNKFGMKIILK